MMTITANAAYTLCMSDDCTLYVYDPRGRQVYESDPNISMNAILAELRERRYESGAIDDASYYLASDIGLALESVKGFAGGIHPDTVKRFYEMADAPSWKLLCWLL